MVTALVTLWWGQVMILAETNTKGAREPSRKMRSSLFCNRPPRVTWAVDGFIMRIEVTAHANHLRFPKK